MKIRRILLRNLHSIRSEVEVDFTESPLSDVGLFAITGDTGAGKTTILDAITLAMYGDICRKADAIDALSYGAEEGLAECEFEAKNRRFLAQWRVRTTRSKDPSKRLKTERSVAEWDEETESFHIIAERRVREVNALVEEVTGLDFPRFTRSVLLAQGEFAAFLRANEKERSDLLERITGTEVYSNLSKAALARRNLEQAELEKLTSQREALALLSSTDLKAKKEELKARKKEEKTVADDLKKIQSEIQLIEKIERLKKKKTELENVKTELEHENQRLQPDLEKLSAHLKITPLRPDLERLNDRQEEAEKLNVEITELNEEIEKLKEQEKASEEKLNTSKEAFEQLRKEQKNKLQLFDEITSLDEKIKGIAASFEKQKKSLEELLEQSQKIKNQKTILSQEIKAKKERENDLKEWLKTNKSAADLEKDLPLIKNFRESLRELYVSKKESQDDFSKIKSNIEKAEKEIAKKEEKWKYEQAELVKLTTIFEAKTPEELTVSRHDLLEKLSHEIETAGNSQERLKQLNEWNKNYKNILAESSELEAQLENMRREELALDKALLSIMEASEEAESHLKFKREIYRQQLLLANFEKARAELKEGEECPVCLSTDHPFRSREVKPFVDAAKEEMEAAEKATENIRKKRGDIVKRHTELASAIHHIDSSTTGQLSKLNAQAVELERKMAALLPHFDAEEFGLSHGDFLRKRLENFEADLQKKKVLRKELSALNQKVTQQEQIVQNLSVEKRDLEYRISSLRDSLQATEKNLNEQKNKFDKTAKELNQLVKKYGYEFSVEKANGMFTELEIKEKEYSEYNQEFIALKNQLALNEQKLEQLKTSAKELSKNIEKVKAEYSEEEKYLIEMKAYRHEKFVAKNPQDERELFLKKLEDSELVFTKNKSKYDEIISNFKLAEKSKKDREKNLSKTHDSIQKINEKLARKIKSLGFETVQEIQKALLPEADFEKIQATQENLKKRKIEWEQETRNVDKEWEQANQNPLPKKLVHELKNEQRELENKSKEIQQSIGALQQQLLDNEQRSLEAKRLLEQIDEQRSVFNRWNDLYDLIGSSDGKKFRVFAQGLTLQKLVQLANVHLSNLHGRYFILKRPNEDLELDIVDTYQAENVRSMHTLSGGESFLVSLALALGLSDLAGRNANIRSLFIDEGFGTLDDQALDVAITTLENLQASGKTIGVISHVKELKERISTQVRLVKKGGGVSEVEVVG